MSKPKCHYVSGDGWKSPEHLRDCTDTECKGCRPCSDHHCAMRGKCPNHVKHEAGIVTCPSCIGRTRSDLQRIEDRYSEVWDEVVEAGVDSEAANLIGPAASPEQVKARRLAGVHVEDFAPPTKRRPAIINDPHHPYAVLGRWDMALREDYDQPTDLLVSVSRAKAYLAGMLDHFAQDQPQAFEEFAKEVSTCLAHLESVLSDSRRPEKGAPCPKCAEPMVRKYGTQAKDDKWACQCGEEMTDDKYREHSEQQHFLKADMLTSEGVAVRLGVSASTVRRWAGQIRIVRDLEPVMYPPALYPCAADGEGRKLYRVSSAEDVRRGFCDFPRVSLDNETLDVSKSG